MSTIPVRKTTRVTRATKNTENANARPSRVATRSKTLAAEPLAPVTTRATAATAASKAKALAPEAETSAGKRKREVLVEVTGLVTNNKTKGKGSSTTTLKGKESTTAKGKEKESEVAKKPAVSKVLRVRPAAAASGIAKHVRGASVSTTASSKTGTEEGSVTERVALKRAVTKKVPSFAAKAETQTRTTTAAARGKALLKQEVDDVEEGHRVFKRRHVDIPEEPIQQDQSQIEADRIAAELIEADAKAVPEFKEEPIELWDDLDAGDWDDPFMVSEYVVEVCKYWKELEVETLPQGDYMERQAEITWEHRGILVDWILQVHARFNMLQESFLLSVNVLDRFLSRRQISIGRLQLVGLASFLIATKFEETYAPSVAEMVALADKQYTADDILKAERYILKTLNWDLRAPGPMNWLRRGSKADHSETKARTIAKYLIEIGCLEWKLVAVVPSLISAAALWLARLTLGREEWTPNLAHYTTYSEEEILPTANIMLEYILTNPVQHESLYKKFSSRRYFRASPGMLAWALDRWPENGNVDLELDLVHIKDDIRRDRLRGVEGVSEELESPF